MSTKDLFQYYVDALDENSVFPEVPVKTTNFGKVTVKLLFKDGDDKVVGEITDPGDTQELGEFFRMSQQAQKPLFATIHADGKIEVDADVSA